MIPISTFTDLAIFDVFRTEKGKKGTLICYIMYVFKCLIGVNQINGLVRKKVGKYFCEYYKKQTS